ncbi:hypothetical protein [Rhodobaculum claviforme]|uniref:hypothetical protein n=1 Tax=Rhodobaculum claviforme TaxID=1549854 RepID=UPI001913DDDC|nr:hypothetical protein [Rhodobaculum claviforme]
MHKHVDRDLDLIEQAWADHARFSHVPTATLTLSCLLEAGRHDELLALLKLRNIRMWSDERFATEALLRQGREDEALARAKSMLQDHRRGCTASTTGASDQLGSRAAIWPVSRSKRATPPCWRPKTN